MNIPSEQVTLKFLKERLESAFFDTLEHDENSIVVTTNDGKKYLISIVRSDCVRIQCFYSLTEYSATNFQKALEQANQANKEFIGIQTHIDRSKNDLYADFSFYMFFNEIFDLKFFVSNLNFVNRVSTQIMQDIFYA